ncbi:Os03g0194350 [Oryza sativa Japonica Group]|uniref:Os03g0194350 protein n=1 Tax=Oryza sativa subsp. japonica TaxID=39947 RepID=A0A0P0VU80_ORYSJ|nr:hypothetical protein EE612_015851 [Oryza sativa]BAS82750.1 Os03g0194350 [Oryza sativa Japonica Group]
MVAAMVTVAPSRTVRAGSTREAEEASSGMSSGRDTSGDAWSLTSGERRNGSARSAPVEGSENAASTRAPVIAGASLLTPQATHPDGEMKEPVNAASSVALRASYVHASVAPCVGSAMHLAYVFNGVDVVHLPAAPPAAAAAAAAAAAGRTATATSCSSEARSVAQRCCRIVATCARTCDCVCCHHGAR